MWRRLLNKSAVFYLVLCVAMIALWGRSYFGVDAFHVPRTRTMSVYSSQGKIGLEWFHPDWRTAIVTHIRPYSQRQFFIGSLYFEWLDSTYAARLNYPVGMIVRWQLDVHDWFFVTMFGLLAVLLIARNRLLRGLVPAGICAACGYDLRATPERCPECGAVVE